MVLVVMSCSLDSYALANLFIVSAQCSYWSTFGLVFGVMLNMFAAYGCALDWNAFGNGTAVVAPPKACGLLSAVGIAGATAPPKLNAFAGTFAVLPPK